MRTARWRQRGSVAKSAPIHCRRRLPAVAHAAGEGGDRGVRCDCYRLKRVSIRTCDQNWRTEKNEPISLKFFNEINQIQCENLVFRPNRAKNENRPRFMGEAARLLLQLRLAASSGWIAED